MPQVADLKGLCEAIAVAWSMDKRATSARVDWLQGQKMYIDTAATGIDA